MCVVGVNMENVIQAMYMINNATVFPVMTNEAVGTVPFLSE